MHRLLVDLREFDVRGGWHAQGAQSCAHWLSWRVGWTLATARDHVRVASKLPEVPAISDALRHGEVSYSKVRAMLRIATPANERLLLDCARFMTASQLEETCRKYALVLRHGQDPHPLGDLQRRYVRRRDTEDGMVKIEAVLHPEEAELIWTTLTHAATQLARSPESAKPESHSNNVSAETPPLIPAQATSETSVQSATTASDVSTEKWNSLPVRLAPAISIHHPTPTQPTPTATSISPDTITSDVSAETHEQLPSCPAPPATSIGPATTSDVSAETHEQLPSCATPPATSIGPDTTTRDVSSETQGPGTERMLSSTSSTVLRECEERRTDEHGAESDRTSLLDRLLDEAEALRVADAVSEGIEQAAVTEPRRASHPGVLHQRADAVRRAFSRADALVALAQGYLRGDRPNRSPIEVTLTTPASSLRTRSSQPVGVKQQVGDEQLVGAWHAVEVGELGESFVSCETARRLSCDSGVIEMVEDDNGVPLSVGRKRRTISGRLKRALLERDKTCTFPGCTNHLFLESHHIKHWADGGETSLDNATLLCTFHHHYVHEYGYTIELDSDQRPRFRDPHGWPVDAVPERPAVADLGWPSIRAANEPLAMSAETNACKWDGNPVDHGAVIGYLVVADGLT
jgi:hypothetical protein